MQKVGAQPIRVLVIDDTPAMRELLVAILQSAEGIQVVGVGSNGLDAVRLAKRLRPDVVTMDIVMPQMDGLEATRYIMCEAPTRIVIPAINVDALVVEGDTWEQLKLGVGHHLHTANPGERGNMVLSAHNDIYGEIFRRLPELELGDEVTIYAEEQPYRYIVTAKQIVEPTEVSVMAPTTKPVATLISCYPYMVDTHRIIVIAELQ